MDDDDKDRFACKVCGNRPDADGLIQHGKGCYVVSEDGGGESYVDVDEEVQP